MGVEAVKRGSVVFGIKIALLAVVDLACIALLFYPRSELADGLFPWMVANILLVLFLLDLLVLALPFVCAHLRVHSAAPPILIALLYFAFTLTFTYLTRAWIDPYWYAVDSLLALCAYTLCMGSLRLASGGRRKKQGPQVRMEDMQLLMLQLQTCLHQLRPALDNHEFDSFSKALGNLRERLEFSAPFGRSNQPVVQDMEQQAFVRAQKLLARMQAIAAGQGQKEDIRSLVSETMSIMELLKSREKLRIV